MQELIPLQRRYIEVLHLELNVCNAWIAHAAGNLAWLLGKDGQPRTSAQGSCDQDGFDFFAHLVRVHGSGLKRPRTQFGGGQCAIVFQDGGARVWNDPALRPGMDGLRDGDHGHWIDSLQHVFSAVHAILQLVNVPDSRDYDVAGAVDRFVTHAGKFCHPGVDKPFAYRWGLYDHGIAHHLLPQMAQLAQSGLSLAQVSSRSLEACNRPAKRTLRKLPGGGKERAEHAHEPIVQALKRLTARNCVGRLGLLDGIDGLTGEGRGEEVVAYATEIV